APRVAPVTGYTTDPSITLQVCGLVSGTSSITACGEGGCANTFVPTAYCNMGCSGAVCYDARVPLAQDQLNHLMVCQLNTLCPDAGCVGQSVTGDPLQIIQEAATPSPTP